jgi:hypothetical protein
VSSSLKYAIFVFALVISTNSSPHDPSAASTPPPAITKLLFGQAQLLRAFATNLIQRPSAAPTTETLTIDGITWEFMSCHVALATIADNAYLYSSAVDSRDKERIGLLLGKQRLATIAMGEAALRYLDRQQSLLTEPGVSLQVQLGQEAIRTATDALKAWNPERPQ